MAEATWDGRVARTRRINRPRLTAPKKNRGEGGTALELFHSSLPALTCPVHMAGWSPRKRRVSGATPTSFFRAAGQFEPNYCCVDPLIFDGNAVTASGY